jgi:hypothetical protein
MRHALALAPLVALLFAAGFSQKPAEPSKTPAPLRFRSAPGKADLPAADLPLPPLLPPATKLGWLRTGKREGGSASDTLGSVLSLTPGASTALVPGSSVPRAILTFTHAELVGNTVARFDGNSARESLVFQFLPDDIGLYLVEFRLQPGTRHACTVTGPGGVRSSFELPAAGSSIPAVLDARERSWQNFTLACSGGQWMFRSVEVSTVR